MNHQLWTRVGARVLAVMFVVAGAAACGERENTTLSANDRAANGASGDGVAARAEHSGLPADASPSAVVIGTAPAPPTSGTAATTPPEGGRSEISKSEQAQGMPNEGDNHSYSTTAPNSPQKAGGVDPVALESK